MKKNKQKNNLNNDLDNRNIGEWYMDWISEFTQKVAAFDSDIYKYNDIGLSKADINNVKRLEEFFRIIERYAEENNIESHGIECKFATTKNYYIKYQDKIYTIGFISENETIFYCSVKIVDNKVESIPFEDIEKYQNKRKVKNIKSLEEEPIKMVRQKTKSTK